MSLYIISGMSGAGKSQALKIFEDFGFFCINNVPVQIFSNFVDLYLESSINKYENIAIGIDLRGCEPIKCFNNLLVYLKKKIKYEIIFFNASDNILMKRYSETRHRHPFSNDSLFEGIMHERKIMNYVYKISDRIIDTTDINIIELKELISTFLDVYRCNEDRLNILVISFGYKFGIPNDADIIYDMRFLTNPNYVDNLKLKTGNETDVGDYIEKQSMFQCFFNMFSDLINKTIPLYVKNGKTYLTIAFGCTGGKHRSVFTAVKLTDFLKNKKYKVRLRHRDIFI
ncbi:MAG: RNase adapter RapZ [Endomicrobium sp.]|jgi:UPF0042 nucleotide-binding protein|nr:RNase adapter RapZ [Endomicrobium sp.]